MTKTTNNADGREKDGNEDEEGKKKTIRTLHGLKRFAEKAFEGREDMPDGSQEIILSFKRRRIIIYDDYME